MLSSITLQFTEQDKLTLHTGGIIIFVGPNNSGKSLILKEIERAFNEHPFPRNTLILQDYEVQWLEEAEIDAALTKYTQKSPGIVPAGHEVIGRINPNKGRETTQLHIDSLKHIGREKRDKYWWVTQFLKWGVLRLDGRSRFLLTDDREAGDLLMPPQNILSHLFQNDAARSKVRELIKDAFGLTFVIDPTDLGKLRIRLSSEKELSDEQSLNALARNYYKQAVHIKDASDGVQAFTGIVTAVLSGDFHTILIDEPEAFLHPPLARKLGTNLAKIATENQATLFASTHSADFLMGCVQHSKNVSVVRLEYTNGKSQGRMVDPVELKKLFQNPLMRSTNAISGLFYDGVVVTESDNDRVFYAEIYHRLAIAHKDYPSILFINAQNKQTIKNIIGPLRKFGVPAVAITDIDILKDGGKTWTDWLSAAYIPDALHSGFANQRASIKTLLEETGKDMKLDGGISILSTQDRQAALQLLQTLAEYGIFVVPHGELEQWLAPLGITGKKTEWTIAMLQRLGSDPTDQNYVNPSRGDVWNFVSNIVSWVQNGSRKGTS